VTVYAITLLRFTDRAADDLYGTPLGKGVE
jgi:hypothetical protein